ncbi:MAG: hypothetical protein WAW42_03230 [Candidatus Competibacteraceae bacterium]|jgi:hypothetical protein
MKLQFLKGGLAALAMMGLFALPIQEAGAATKCKETIVNGRVVKRVCATTPQYRYRTVCNEYWRHGTKYRSCKKVRVRVY